MLPVRIDPRPGQCIEDWLEHVAEHNSMPTGQLTALIGHGEGPVRFLSVKPTDRVVARIVEMTGLSSAVVRSTTLQRFDGSGIVELDGLDPDHWSTWRRVAGRGWIHATGSAACPHCLSSNGMWQLRWRLPSSTVCTRHRCYLIEQCPGCGRRFLDHPHTPLRPAPGSRCLNPLPGRGYCDVDVSSLHTTPAPDDCLARQSRHDHALNGTAPTVLGTASNPPGYLLDVWALTILLLHLATTSAATGLAAWTNELLAETASRREENREQNLEGPSSAARGGPVRWSLHPPTSPATRSRALATADAIITAPDLDAAGAALHPWIAAAPGTTDSRLGWLADRTRMTPTLTRICIAALAPHQRISHALHASPLAVEIDQIPQAIPEPTYHRNAAHLFRAGGETPRHFLALCLARHYDPTLTWAGAADILGVPPQHGTKTARAISARHHLDLRDLDRALRAIVDDLQDDRCHLEGLVRASAEESDWFHDWSKQYRPGTRRSSLPYAVTWLWCHVAGGLLRTSPAWPEPPEQTVRAAFRQFEATLTPWATAALAALVRPLR
ncbi:TniQ family protein [Isoptericola croceus]|uniref:TniQ family protein n=1 Tax=Isoptericola croceus TaxID=3031406 RepID=UPI0023F641E2|nr:TniQ family protein [Isoptericola croceus]